MSEHHSTEHPSTDQTTGRRARLAYLITSYGDGVQLERLVRTLRTTDPGAAVVVQHDETHHPVRRDPLEALGVHVLVSPERIEWGDLTLERARWRLFGWVLDHLDVDWVMLLSEQDYPTAPASVLHGRLLDATAASSNAIIESWPIDEVPDPGIRAEAQQRYRFQYTKLPSVDLERRLPAPLVRAVRAVRGIAIHRLRVHRMPVRIYGANDGLGVPARVGVRALRTPFTRDAPCWYDNSWFAIDRRAMRAVVDRVRSDPALVRYFERTMIPVEAVTPTVIGNHPDLRTEHASLHSIRWSDPTSGRPDEYTVEDVAALLDSGLPFARKFGPDPRVLDLLDEHLLARTEERSA